MNPAPSSAMASGRARLRIGICAPYDLGRAGGVNTHIRDQARALQAFGHDVTIFGASSAPLPEGEIALAAALRLVIGQTETGLGLDPRSAARVKALLADRRFDILHVHEPLMPLLPWLVVHQATVPVVATFHAHRERGHRWYRLARPLLARLMRRVAVAIAVSESARRTVEPHFPGPYEIVPNGIHLDRFRAPQRPPPEMPPGRRCLLYVGRLEPRKGVEVLLRAVARLQPPGAALVIVGDGPDREPLKRLATEARADARFVGAVDDRSLPAFFQAADVVCAPALGGESFGIVLLEAMASGKPVVASRIDGYLGLVGGVDCGLLVPPGDEAALAAALDTLIEDGHLARTLGARGLAAARAYDWPVVARRLDAIYQGLLRVTGEEGTGSGASAPTARAQAAGR